MPVHSCGSSAHSWLCVCHRAVHSDWADGSNSDDGGHRRGRPCVPGTGSGRMAGKESLQHSQLWALPVGSKWGGFGRWWVGRKPIDRLGSPSGQTHLILQARGFTPTCQEKRLAVAGRDGDFRQPLGRRGKPEPCIDVVAACWGHLRHTGDSPSKMDFLPPFSQVIVSVAQSCLALCDPVHFSLPGSSVYGILQARILKWVAISSSRGSC